MTANSSQLGCVLWNTEASYAEVSTSFARRLPLINNVNDIIAGLSQSLIEPGYTRQYQNDGGRSFKGVQGGSFTLRMWLTGHGSATTGAITASELGLLLGYVIGNNDVTNDGGTVNVPTSATQFSATGLTTTLGAMLRVGALQDGDGEGQFYRVNNASTITLLTAMAGTPLAAAVIYAPEMIYPSEGPTSSTITSLRFQCISTDQRVNIYGCYPTGIEITGLNVGETPQVAITFACAAWETESASSFPSAVTTDFFPPTPTAAGSLWINDVGTTTRQVVDYRNLQISIDLQTVGKTGPGAPRTYQALTACRRLSCQASLSFDLDSETAGTDTWGGKWNAADASRTEQHAVITLSPGADGQCVGFGFPNLKYVGQRPTQMRGGDGTNQKSIMFQAITGATTTNALTLANFMLALG